MTTQIQIPQYSIYFIYFLKLSLVMLVKYIYNISTAHAVSNNEIKKSITSLLLLCIHTQFYESSTTWRRNY